MKKLIKVDINRLKLLLIKRNADGLYIQVLIGRLGICWPEYIDRHNRWTDVYLHKI